MNFTLKHYNTPLVTFSATMDTSDPELENLWHDAEQTTLLPLDMELTPESLGRWLRRRTIPKNRAYIHALLAKYGLNLNRPMGILAACKGLSLNDCYWVASEGDDSDFEKINLYENRFNRVLAALAFTGYGSDARASLRSSPEFTTNGMLPKCWRRIKGKVVLFKAGTEGASNAGFEPYSEFYAAQVAEAMDIEAIFHNLSKWKERICSTCELFTSIDQAFMPVGNLVTKGGMAAVSAYYERLGPEFVRALHAGLRRGDLQCGPALWKLRFFDRQQDQPDFRSGPAVRPRQLSVQLYRDQLLGGSRGLDAYIDTLVPSVYDDFIGTAKAVMGPEHRKMLRNLLTFQFRRHPAYNLPAKRLKLIEKQIQKRARLLLDP